VHPVPERRRALGVSRDAEEGAADAVVCVVPVGRLALVFFFFFFFLAFQFLIKVWLVLLWMPVCRIVSVDALPQAECRGATLGQMKQKPQECGEAQLVSLRTSVGSVLQDAARNGPEMHDFAVGGPDLYGYVGGSGKCLDQFVLLLACHDGEMLNPSAPW
jgi:hypothetical protein